MKTMKTQKLKLAVVALLATQATTTFAQGDALLSETEDILNSEQIDIDGRFRQETPAQRIEKMRKKLEAQNEQMVQKKIEDIRIKQEQELAGKLQEAFQGNAQALDSDMDSGMGNMDSVQTIQAAPTQIIAPMPEKEEEKLKNKIIPFFGVKQFNGDSIDSFESQVNAGISMENMVTDRFSVGLGVNYTTMSINDYTNYYSYNPYGFNDGDKISYTNLNLNLNTKFFLTVDSKIRPYLGLGAGYNRTTLKYDEERTQFNRGYGSQYSFDDGQVSGSNITGTGMVGAEVSFTETLGLNVEFNYTRALTYAFDGQATYYTGTFGEVAEQNLENYGYGLENSDVAALNVGFVIKF